MSKSKYLLRGLQAAALLGFTLATFEVANAAPSDFSLETLDDWQTALRDGNILPVLSCEDSQALMKLHSQELCDQGYREPQLYVVPQLVAESGDVLDDAPGLVMGWGDESDGTEVEILAAWEYVLPVDPDFTNLCIDLTAYPRTGMTSISFSLKDMNNVMKGWRWPVGGSGLPQNAPTSITIVASGGAGQAGSTVFWDGGIDLTQIVSFEFDESGIAAGGIPLPLPLIGTVWQWNYWHDIIVYQCPPKSDHFACYKVKEKTKLDIAPVSLRDQFIAVDDAEVRKAVELCNPVDKNGEGILNRDVHLVCYDVKVKEKVKRSVLVRNQFGEQVLEVKGKIRRLCVPSDKEVIE